MDTMSVRQAFEAMIWFIKQFQDRGPFEDTGSLLSLLNRVCATNANEEGRKLWREWHQCVQKTLQFSGQPNEFPLFELGRASWDEQGVSSETSLTILQAYEATQLFLYQQYDIDSYDWLHMLKASVAIKSDLPQKGCDFLRQTAKTTLVNSVFFGRKSELVTGVADVASGEREDLGRLDGEHENRI